MVEQWTFAILSEPLGSPNSKVVGTIVLTFFFTSRRKSHRGRLPGKEMGHIFPLRTSTPFGRRLKSSCEAQAEFGYWHFSRRGSLIREHAAFNRAEVDEIEAVTNHDVIAFLTNRPYIDAKVPEGVRLSLGSLRYDQQTWAMLSAHPGM